MRAPQQTARVLCVSLTHHPAAAGHNDFKLVPSDMAKLVHLRTLCAGHNRIKSIASQIGHIKYLRRLEVDHNKLLTLPPEMIKVSTRVVAPQHHLPPPASPRTHSWTTSSRST